MNKRMIAAAEENVQKMATKIAYEMTDKYTNPEIQKGLYILCKDLIIAGARLMQEELLNPETNGK